MNYKTNVMRQKVCILGFVVLMSFTAFGQQFISENKQWNVKASGMPLSINTEIYKFRGDTLVDGLVYNLLYYSGDSTSTWHYQGMLREDQNKVYFIRPNSPERLLYDFNLEIGDNSFTTNFICEEIPITVTGIDTIHINGQDRKRWHISVGSSSLDFWIEGIGSLSGPIHSHYEYCIVCPVWELLCYYENESPVYIMPYQTTCFIRSVGLNEHTGKSVLVIKPNPVKQGSSFTVETTSTPMKISVYNSVGILVENIEPGKDNRIQLSTDHLKPGFYFITIVDEANQKTTQKLLIE
jgi:hypothetical protein